MNLRQTTLTFSAHAVPLPPSVLLLGTGLLGMGLLGWRRKVNLNIPPIP